MYNPARTHWCALAAGAVTESQPNWDFRYCGPHCGPSARVKSFKRKTWGCEKSHKPCWINISTLLASTRQIFHFDSERIYFVKRSTRTPTHLAAAAAAYGAIAHNIADRGGAGGD